MEGNGGKWEDFKKFWDFLWEGMGWQLFFDIWGTLPLWGYGNGMNLMSGRVKRKKSPGPQDVKEQVLRGKSKSFLCDSALGGRIFRGVAKRGIFPRTSGASV